MSDRVDQLRTFYGQHFYDWMETLHSRNVNPTPVLLHLLRQIPSCASDTEDDFLLWAEQTISNELADRKWRESMAGLTLAEVLTLAKSRDKRKCKPMEIEVRGEKAFVALYDSKNKLHVWAMDANWLPVAQELWPCALKYSRAIGWYVAKHSRRQLSSGQWVPIYIPVHHIILGVSHARVLAKDNDFLNYSAGNLHLEDDGTEAHVAAPDLIEMQQARLAVASTPLLPTDTQDAKPARATVSYTEKPDVFACPDASAVRALQSAWGVRSR